MKPRYNWQTEEEQEWDLSTPEPVPTSRRKRVWALILLIGLTGMVFTSAIFLFERRLRSQEESVALDVQATHRTLEQAVASEDLELYTSLLSRDDLGWYQLQRRLLQSGRVLDRRVLGLDWKPATPSAPEIDLDPNWRRAIATFPQSYTLMAAEGPAESVTLNQTLYYQIRGSRWLLTKPSAAYWGKEVTREFGRLVISYPERDSLVVDQFADRLLRDVESICEAWLAGGGWATNECSPDWRVFVEFETEPETLLALSSLSAPAMQGRAFLLPAPSLIGIPADETSFDAVYRGYSGRILETLRNNLVTPIPLPDQEIAALCFPSFEDGLRLYTYDPASDLWTQLATDERIRHLQPLPDDSGIVLRGGIPGTDVGRLQLTVHRAGDEQPVFEEGISGYSARLVNIDHRPAGDNLVLSSTQGSTGLTSYRFLPLESCDDGDCETVDLAGYPLWSPDGERSLILAEGELFLGDDSGKRTESAGRAFSPFWMTADTFGFVRLLGGEEVDPEMELVIRSADTGQERPLIRSADLLLRIDADMAGALRIKYVRANPADPSILYMAVTPVASGRSNFFVLRLKVSGGVERLAAETALESIDVVQKLEDIPVGDQTTLTPTGYPPFSLTGDGHWLTTASFSDPLTNAWRLNVSDVEQGQERIYYLNYPHYPAPFPFYDWSGDDQWLVVVDNGFLRLIAPAYDYERIVSHDFAGCRYPAWIDPLD